MVDEQCIKELVKLVKDAIEGLSDEEDDEYEWHESDGTSLVGKKGLALLLVSQFTLDQITWSHCLSVLTSLDEAHDANLFSKCLLDPLSVLLFSCPVCCPVTFIQVVCENLEPAKIFSAKTNSTN